MGKQKDIGHCLVGDGEPSAYWLGDADEPEEVYAVCAHHARVYAGHIRNCDNPPCKFSIAISHEPQSDRG